MRRVLAVGAGSIGERHVRCFLATGRAEVGVCEPSSSTREGVAGRYDLCGTYSSLDAALLESWDAAVVATPAHTHISIATTLAKAAIHLLIEKPLSTSMGGVIELQLEVGTQKLVAGIGYSHRAHPAARAVKDAINSQRFGLPLDMNILCGQSFATYRPGYRDVYFADRAEGGGAIQDALTHLLNLGEWFIGPIDRVVADAAHQQLEGVTVEDTVHTLARHGALLANYAVNLYQQPNEFTATIVCERGTVRYELHNNRWRWMDEVDGTWHDEVFDIPLRDATYTRQAKVFLDALEGKGVPLCTLDEGIQTLRVNLAVLSSVDSEKWEHISGESRC